MTEKYIFVIDTDQYAGNFAREMCACCTGQAGDCGVGKEESDKFIDAVGEEKWEEIMELVEWRRNGFGDDASRRPTSSWSTPIYLSPGRHRNSVAIFFHNMPSEDIMAMMIRRAKLFIKGKTRIMKRSRTMKILGFRLLKETTTLEEITMSDNHCGMCGGFNTTKSREDYTFPYGIAGPEQVELTVEIPVYKCEECGFQWMNWEAGEIIDAYVEQWKHDKDKENPEEASGSTEEKS